MDGMHACKIDVGISQNAHQIRARTTIIMKNIVKIIKTIAESEIRAKVCAKDGGWRWGGEKRCI